ncbi:MAG: hypothetical protein H0W30_01255 [Gemmatimonadaceae bacterium]|nr:hypothetical protein [Gemmatimonadaceae bacterium]MBA3557203.1 hypothetical protein [Gemmatimonadaceae bacterium]
MKASEAKPERSAALERWQLWYERARVARTLNAKVKAECHSLRGYLEGKALATEQELADEWPDGVQNSGKSPWNWVRCYAMYIQFLGRMDDKGSRHGAQSDAAERAILEALSDRPVPIELEALGDAEPLTVSAYPKSFISLDFLDKRDRHIAWLTEQRVKLLALPSTESADALEAVARETSYQYGLVTWAVTHPAPGLPFDPENLPREVPGWIAGITSVDVIRIHDGFIRANLLRLHSLYALLKVETAAASYERPAWTSFFATQSEDSKVPTDLLMRDRSLASQVATAMIAADARKRALEESRNESKREAA